jgi:transcriptional regulator with XRE-family HTH domain
MGYPQASHGPSGPHPLGDLIAEERQRRGLTRAELADVVKKATKGTGTNEKAVARWELHGDIPVPATLRALAVVLELPVEHVVAVAKEQRRLRKSGTSASTGDEGRSSNGLPDLDVGPCEPADHEYVAAVRATVQQLVTLESRLGGDELAPLATRYLQTVQRRVGGSLRAGIERELQAAVAELAELKGWLLHVSDRHYAAQQANYEALHLARVAGDRGMELLILNNVAFLDTVTRRPGSALQTTAMVLETAGLSNRLAAIFSVQRARALALLGDRSGTMSMLDRATSNFLDGVSGQDPYWAWWIDEGEILVHTGRCHSYLGDHAEAVSFIQRSIEDCPPAQASNRFHRLTSLLNAMLRAEAWDDTRSVIEQTIPFIGEVSSGRTIARLQRVATRVQEPAAPASTREAGQHLASVLAAAGY